MSLLTERAEQARSSLEEVAFLTERAKQARSSLEEVALLTERAEQALSSLEELIKHFMVLLTERDRRPEDLMISYVSGEKGEDRSDRELVTPSFKFLWETYRTVLEILRNNSKLESLYEMTAHCAFQFCKQYKRTTEFRRLWEIIRNHLTNLNKYKDQRDRPDLTAPETLQPYLDTRVDQLKIATDLELWQEAFCSVEDIHFLMSMVNKSPKPSVMVILYYAKLTEIFWVSDSYLYHAYAWLSLFTLQKNYNKNLSQKDLQLIASSVLLAALSVMPYDHKHGVSHLELENEKERNLRMANLLGFNLDLKRDNREVLSRSSLLSELASKGILSCISQEVKDLYNLLEHEFLPLDLASRVQPLLAKISKLSSASSVPEVQLSQYIPALEKLTTLRVLQQVSQVYRSMKFETLSRMIPFSDLLAVEKMSVDAQKYNFVAMKFDHVKGAVHFGNRDIEADQLSDHLTIFTQSLNNARSLIHPPLRKIFKLGESVINLADTLEREHKRRLTRKRIIEKREEEHECQMLEIEREVESKKQKQKKITEKTENIRFQNEVAIREKERICRESEEKGHQEALQMPKDAQKHQKKGKKPIIGGDEFTKQSVIDYNLTAQVKDCQEMEKNLNKLGKTMDYMERAKREEKTPIFEQAFQQRLVEEQHLHEQEQLKERELSRQHHAGDLQEKNRLVRMLENKVIFQQRIDSRREAEFNRLKQERDDRIRGQVAALKRDREIKRKLLFVLKSEEERLSKLREEEEARKREGAERKKKEDAEKQAKLDEIFEKQKQREKELEEKDRLRREALLAKSLEPPRPAEPDSPARPEPAATYGKYDPRHRWLAEAGQGPSAAPLGQKAERKTKEDAEKQARLNEIFKKQKQREKELEEKDRLRRALLAKSLVLLRSAEPGSPARPEPAPTAGKYVPRHRWLAEVGQGPSAAPLGQSTRAPFAASPDTDRWTMRDGPDTDPDRWSRRDGPPPPGDSHRSDELRPPPGVGGGSKYPWRRN